AERRAEEAQAEVGRGQRPGQPPHAAGVRPDGGWALDRRGGGGGGGAPGGPPGSRRASPRPCRAPPCAPRPPRPPAPAPLPPRGAAVARSGSSTLIIPTSWTSAVSRRSSELMRTEKCSSSTRQNSSPKKNRVLTGEMAPMASVTWRSSENQIDTSSVSTAVKT